MRIQIDAGDCDRPRCQRAAAELRRMKEACEHAYYVRVAEGRMERSLANERLESMATALLLCQATDDALGLAERMREDKTLFDAIAPKPLPYDKGDAVRDEAPRCRFCGLPGERAGKGADTWRCSAKECVGRREWVRAEIFNGIAK